MGKGFPEGRQRALTKNAYAEAISAALRADTGGNQIAIKTVMQWTGSSERTVKNWISGTHGPTGEHLITLACHSASVKEALFRLIGVAVPAAQLDINLLRAKITELLSIIEG